MITTLAPFASTKTLANTISFGNVKISCLLTAEQTAGTFSLLEAVMRPGSEPPYHVHEREDETFYLLEGHLSVMVDGQIFECHAGQTMFLPRGLPHTFRIRSESARGLIMLNPSGFEKYFQAVGRPTDSLDVTSCASEPLDYALMGEAARKCGIQFMAEQPVF